MTTKRDHRHMNIVAVVAMLTAFASPTVARAQRIAVVGFVPARVSAPRPAPTAIDIGPRSILAHHAADSTANAGSSQAVGLGALAGAILGASYGYALGANDCDGPSQAGCRSTALITVGAVGTVLGALAGHVIQIGEEHDARRASARAAADSARSTPSAPHP